MTPEVNPLDIGQADVQVKNSCSHIYCLEHGIYNDGKLKSADGNCETELLSTFFSET